MKQGFWKNLPIPAVLLAPMANVTDVAFRSLFAKYGPPDVYWTEFVSVEGLLSEGREMILPDLWFEKNQRPIVAQIFGNKPAQFEQVAFQLAAMGFDGIDINMGCPDKNVLKQGSGAALCQTPELAKEIIAATKRGAPKLPVSVKARIGWNENEVERWVSDLLEAEPSAITMHARTKKEMSKVPARWDVLKQMVSFVAKEIPDKEKRPLLFGNGDVFSLEEADRRVRETGVDGVMIGRGIFGNPFFFNREKNITDLSIAERLAVLIEHTNLFEKYFGAGTAPNGGRLKNFAVMKKHYKAYVNDFEGAKELRVALMAAESLAEISKILQSHRYEL